MTQKNQEDTSVDEQKMNTNPEEEQVNDTAAKTEDSAEKQKSAEEQAEDDASLASADMSRQVELQNEDGTIPGQTAKVNDGQARPISK
jgi:hypothetical protein